MVSPIFLLCVRVCVRRYFSFLFVVQTHSLHFSQFFRTCFFTIENLIRKNGELAKKTFKESMSARFWFHFHFKLNNFVIYTTFLVVHILFHCVKQRKSSHDIFECAHTNTIQISTRKGHF